MRLTLQVGGAELDMAVGASAGATVADLAAALAGGALAPGTGLEVDGRFLEPAAPVAGAGLRQGDVLRLASGPGPGDGGWVGAPEAAAAVAADLHVVGGPCAGMRLPLSLGAVVVGRGGDVVVDHPTVSRRHARLQVGHGGHCVVEDLGSTNGTRVDGRFVTSPQQVVPGQLLELGAVQARVVARPSGSATAVLGPAGVATGTAPFNRPPRSLLPAGPAPVAVPVAPPEPAPGSRFSWAMLVAPLVVGLVLAVIFDPMMAAFALFSPVITVGMWWEDRRRARREGERSRRQLSADVAAFRAGLAAAQDAEAARRAQVVVDPAETLGRAAGPSTTVWERRRHAPDAFRLFLGLADAAWPPPLSEPAGTRPTGVDEALAAHGVLPRSPVVVDLGAGSVLGVVGPREAVAGLLRSLTCQAAVHHGPSDLRIAVLTEAAVAPAWDWAKWLPHTEGLRAAGREDAERLASAWAGAGGGGGPGLLAVVDGDGFTEGRLAPVRDLLASGSVGGVVVASSAARLPSCCTAVLELSGPDGLGRLHEPAGPAGVDNLLVAAVPEAEARQCARALARLEDPEEGDGAGRLPDDVQLAGLAGLRSLDAAEVGRRWRAASAASSLRAVVGVSAEGPLVLDLVADGPHALMAGTTGAGKSELLRTLVASLAATYGPDQLAFVLVDYKGGSAFAECARLPHVVGMVTDLDEELGERALRSLEAELRHREQVLAAAGAADLAEYHHGRLQGGGGPLPRLVVVVDEFATMKAELGDFVDSLVGIAQRGRSLGVHLVLATQRPSGAVSDNIRANTNLRIALRVQDGPDSTDVLGTPQAAAVDRRRPGRGFVRLGPGEVVAFQAALVSTAGSVEGAGSHGLVRARPFGFLPEPAAGIGTAAGPTHLAALVEAAATAAGGVSPRRVWQEPLPAELALHGLPAGALGLADEPHHQRQVPFGWDPAAGNLLLYGVAGSGTTTALASLALSLVRAPGGAGRHLYVLDFGNGALAPLAGLPQVGAVVAAGERERQERLLRSLRAELERRRELVAAGRSDAWPATVLLVDNLGGFCAAFDDVAGMAGRDGLLRLAADGPALGMVLAATADRPGAVPMALSSVVAERLVFRLADPYDDTAFGLPAATGRRRAPGRAVDVATRRQVQVALPAPQGLAGLAGAVAASAAAVPGPVPAPAPVAVLPCEVDVEGVAGSADLGGAEWLLPLGLGDTALAPVGLPLGPGDHALVAGPARSGKSTLLCTLAAVVAGTGRDDVAVWGVASRRSPLRDVASLAGLITDPADLAAGLASALGGAGPLLLLVDDAETLDDPAGTLDALLAARRPDVHVVAAGRADALRALYGHWTTMLRRSRLGVALRPHLDLDGDLWHTVLPRRGPDRFPPGRGYLVCEGAAELVQVAGGGTRPAPARP